VERGLLPALGMRDSAGGGVLVLARVLMYLIFALFARPNFDFMEFVAACRQEG
jgi:hypothetical protein